MARALPFALAVFTTVLATFFGWPAPLARAEAPNARAMPVYVLTLWTEDSDNQADALTQALRARVRQAPGWSLLETTQSFETLAIALKCPARPDSSCLQHIGDQLHADQYVWGTMTRKKASSGEVTADLHLWTRGRSSTEASESYSDNLKDASDESVRAVASRLFGRLTAANAAGLIVVRAGRASGAVLVDGVEKAPLEAGTARVEVPAGSHTVGVRVSGFEAAEQMTDIASGSEQSLTFALAPASREASSEGRSSPFPVAKVLGYSAIVLGAGFLVAGGVEALHWVSDSNASANDRAAVPKNVTDVCTDLAQAAQDACDKSKDAVSVSTLAWIFAGAGAVLVGSGVVLVASDHGSSEAGSRAGARTPVRAARSVQLLPALGPRAGSVSLRVEF